MAASTEQDQPQPAPVQVHGRTFELAADPAALEASAASVRGYGMLAVAARDAVDTAARSVAEENAWEGEAADAYQAHRVRLSGDLGHLGSATSAAAEIIEYVAAVLRLGQARLDTEEAKLAAIPYTESEVIGPRSTRGGVIRTYEPADAEQATLLSDAVAAAREIRTEVDEQLALQEAALQRVLDGSAVPDPLVGNQPGLTTLVDSWPPLPEILDRYQVEDDEMTRWPANVFRIPGVDVTESERALLDSAGISAVAMFDIASSAKDTAAQRFAEPTDDSHRNAFQHAYWNALMAWYYGQDFAAAYGTAHERIPGNPADREAMDLHNNELGRRIAEENPDATPAELADLVEEAVRGGDVVVIDAYGDLAYSDDVPEGQTGTANDPPRPGGDYNPGPVA